MSYLIQMLGMTVQNFLSAATGMAVLIALIRGIARHTAKGISNLRRKIEPDPSRPHYLLTEPGVGYRIRV